MPYDIVVDPRGLIAAADVVEAQLPFATMKALNEMATTFQAAEQKNLLAAMTIRRPWVLQGIKIDRGDFATKSNLSARVHIDDSRGFLDKFEQGGTRQPVSTQALAVPIAARPAVQLLIPGGLRPKALNFHEVSGAKLAATSRQLKSVRLRHGVLGGGMRVYEGDKRTILIQAPNGAGVILQRVGKSRARLTRGVAAGTGRTAVASSWVSGHDSGLRVLYVLRPQTRVPSSLHFYATATATAARWPEIFPRWYAQAIKTAR